MKYNHTIVVSVLVMASSAYSLEASTLARTIWQDQQKVITMTLSNGWGILQPLKRYNDVMGRLMDIPALWAVGRDKVWTYIKEADTSKKLGHFEKLMTNAETALLKVLSMAFEQYTQPRLQTPMAQKNGILPEQLADKSIFKRSPVKNYAWLKRRVVHMLRPHAIMIRRALRTLVGGEQKLQTFIKTTYVTAEPNSPESLLIYSLISLGRAIHNVMTKGMDQLRP